MSRKSLILVIVIIILAILIGLLVISGKVGPQGFEDNENTEERGGFFANLFPFGESGSPNTNNNTNNNQTLEENTNLSGGVGLNATLQQLTSVPIAGYISSTTDSGVVVRYVEKTTGNLYQVNPETLERIRITNTTYPRVQKAYIHKNGDRVFLQTINNNVIETQLGIVGTSSSTTTNEGASQLLLSPLPNNLRNMTQSRDGISVLYTRATSDGVGVYTNTFDTTSEFLFESAFTDWKFEHLNNELLSATTRASNGIVGYAYTIDVNDGSFTKIIEAPGLTSTFSNNGQFGLYTINNDQTLDLKTINNETGEIGEPAFETLIDKCVWSSQYVDGAYCAVPASSNQNDMPDSWYKGLTSTSDVLWEVDVNRSVTRLLVNPEDFGNEVDVINLHVDENDDYIFFINKKDSTLWAVNLK